MSFLIRYPTKAYRILHRRVRDHGLKTTLIWLYGRGIPKLTGIPLLQFSRITPQIYVGPQYGKRGKTHLEKNGINADVNMRIEFDDAVHGLDLTRYCYLPTVDDDAPTMEHLQKGVEFIKQAVDAGESVYIHCAGGIGRAPTMATAYFISTGMRLDDAIALIKKTRPFIYIMPPQMERLREFERVYQLQR